MITSSFTGHSSPHGPRLELLGDWQPRYGGVAPGPSLRAASLLSPAAMPARSCLGQLVATHPSIMTGPGASPDLLEALDPDTGPERLAQLSRSTDWRARAQVAERPNTLFEVLGALALDECPEVVAALAARPDLPLPLLDELLEHPHDGVRAWAAEHPALTPALQAAAAHDPSIQVRLALANRDQLADRVRRMLAADAVPVVRAAVLAHPSTPRWIWRKGVRDPAPGNRLILLERPDLGPGAALEIISDEALHGLPGVDELIEPVLTRAFQGLRPARRRGIASRLLNMPGRLIRTATITALGVR